MLVNYILNQKHSNSFYYLIEGASINHAILKLPVNRYRFIFFALFLLPVKSYRLEIIVIGKNIRTNFIIQLIVQA